MRSFSCSEFCRAAWAALGLALLGCGAAPSEAPSGFGGASQSGGGAAASSAGMSGAGAAGSSGSGGTGGSPGHARCRAPAGVSASPQTIEEAVALLNALPKPTNVACFLESLDRPLQAFATSNAISAQPAFSTRSPRVLLRLNRLLLSVVIEGESSELIEFSYLIDDDARSIKGELAMPLLSAVSNADPYTRVQSNQGTQCGVCHGSEERVDSIGYAQAYSSVAFRPNTSYRVPLPTLVHERESCDALAEPARCEMLAALFDYGVVTDAQFSQTMTLFF